MGLGSALFKVGRKAVPAAGRGVRRAGSEIGSVLRGPTVRRAGGIAATGAAGAGAIWAGGKALGSAFRNIGVGAGRGGAAFIDPFLPGDQSPDVGPQGGGAFGGEGIGSLLLIGGAVAVGAVVLSRRKK